MKWKVYLPLERDVCGRWSDQARCSSLPVAALLQQPFPYGLQPERKSSRVHKSKGFKIIRTAFFSSKGIRQFIYSTRI